MEKIKDKIVRKDNISNDNDNSINVNGNKCDVVNANKIANLNTQIFCVSLFNKLKNRIQTAHEIKALERKISSCMDADRTLEYKIELINKYFLIGNYNKVVFLQQELLTHHIPTNISVMLLKNICISLSITNNHQQLIQLIEKIFNSPIILSIQDIVFFKTYKGFCNFELKEYKKTIEIFDSISNLDIDDEKKYASIIVKTNSYIALKDYNNALSSICNIFDYINQRNIYIFYSVLNLIFFEQNNKDLCEQVLRIRKLIKNKKKFNFQECLFIGQKTDIIAYKTNKKEFFKFSIKFYKQALKKTMNQKYISKILFYIAVDYLELKNFYKAKGYFKIAIKNCTENNKIIDYLEGLAYSYFMTGMYDESIKIFKELLKHTDKFSEANIFCFLAMNYLKKNNLQMAQQYIKKSYLSDKNKKSIQDEYIKIMRIKEGKIL